MINFGENTIEQYQEALESLAYELSTYQNPRQYTHSDKEIIDILQCEGLNVNCDEDYKF